MFAFFSLRFAQTLVFVAGLVQTNGTALRDVVKPVLGGAMLLYVLGTLSACGGPSQLVAEFTSVVVQRDTCRVTGSGNESCFANEETQRLRVNVVDDLDQQTVWLSGISRAGQPDRRVLGTHDSKGGYLFYAQSSQESADTGCALTSTLQLSLHVDENADASQVGIDPCIALVGREIRTTATNAACDDINDPPQPIVRTDRRRWEAPVTCNADLTD